MLPDRVNLRALVVIVFVAFAAAVSPPLAAQEEQRVVRGLSFEGNHAIDGYTLESAIATTKSGTFATSPLLRWMGLGEKRYFDELEFRRDVVRLLLLYRQSGYMNAVIDTLVRRTAKDVWVKFRIYEGAPVRVTKLELLGIDSATFDLRALRRQLPLRVGDPFDRFLFQASADTVASWLRNRGFPWADVLRNFDSDAATLSAQVSLEAVPGPHARIGEIEVRGLEHMDTGTVLRMLSVHPREPYQQDRLYQSQRDLYGLGVFRAASVGLRDTIPPAAGPSDTLVGVLVRVVEGPRHGIRFGAGYGTVDCFRLQSGWSARDFLGGGRSLDITGRVSKLGVGYPFDAGFRDRVVCQALQSDFTSDTVNYSVGATLTQPAFISPRHTASVGVFAERRSEFEAYVRQSVGANLALTFNARRTVPLTVGYSFSVGRTTAQPAVYCSLFRVCADSDQAFLSNSRRFAAVTVSAVRDRINNILDPTEGSLVSLNLMHTSRLVGSDPFYEFNRGELQVAQYYPFGRRGVFAWRLRGGTILPQRITLSGQSARFVPPEQRFYAGGPNSVRGYGLNELGPVVYVVTDTSDSTGRRVTPAGDTLYSTLDTKPTGGNSVFVFNAELRFATPLFPQRMRVGLFVDVGQVWNRGQEILSTKSLRVTPGVGLRFATPLGPVRLDAAYRGNASEAGPLLFSDGANLTQIRASYRTPRPQNFWGRIKLQFAVGQAF
jgi:outer membrane protein insertion porin family